MAKKLALIIGIENYPKTSGQDKVNYAINDALAIAQYASQAGFYLINFGKPLLDKEATYKSVLKMLKSLSDYANPDDFILIYYAGHGHYAEDGGYLIPFDYNKGSDVDESSCISFDSFEKRLRDKKTSRFIFFLDTCHSGFAGKQLDLRKTTTVDENVPLQVRNRIEEQMNSIVHFDEFLPNVARVIFTSSGSHEKSHSIQKFKHGLFTYYLLFNLRMSKSKLQINIEELIHNVKADIEKFCFEHQLPKQTPTAYTNIEGTFLIPAFDPERNNKDKKTAFNPHFLDISNMAGRDLELEIINSDETLNDNEANEGKNKLTKDIRSKKKIITFFISILLIISIALTIFIKNKVDKDMTEKIEQDNQAYNVAFIEDSIDSYSKYISAHQAGLHLLEAQERLEFLKEMPSEVYRLNILPKIKISKNSKGFWEAYFEEFDISTVYIPSGIFKMGQSIEEKEWLLKQVDKKTYEKYYKDETPVHDVFLDAYWVGKTEVTNKQYVKFLNDMGIDHKDGCQGNQCIDIKTEYLTSHIMGSKGNYYVEPGYENYPITDISWHGALEYCNWLSQKTGFNFILPTEAQWEKAARWFESAEEKRGFMFPWGNQEPNKIYANFNSKGITPVDSYPEGTSPLGLLNMAGNVGEWCSDWYDENYYSLSSEKNPIGPKSGKLRVRRGGDWNREAISLRCAARQKDIPSKCYSNVGFRICQDIKDVVLLRQQLP